MVPKLLLSYKLLVRRDHNNHLGQLLICLYQAVVQTLLKHLSSGWLVLALIPSTNGVKKAQRDIFSTVPSGIILVKSKQYLVCYHALLPQSCLT